MIWNISVIVPFITFFLYVGLLFLVFISRPQTESRRMFRWYLLSMAIWSLSAFFLLIDLGHSLLWMRFYSAGGLTLMISLFYFTQTVIEPKTHWAKYVIYYGLISIILTLTSNFVIISASIENSTVQFDSGIGFLFISGPSALLVIYSIYQLIKSYLSTTDVIQRNRLLYLITAISMVPLINLVNFTPLGKYPVDVAVYGVSALLIAYAILRYQLLDIRIVIRQGLLYSIPTILIGTTYFLVITLSLNVFSFYTGAEIFLTSLVVAIITAMIAEPLREKAQDFIDRLFFRETYNSTLMLQNLSGKVATILDIYKITSMILEEVCSTLHIPFAAFFLRDQSSNRFQLTTQVGQESTQNIEFRQGHPLVLWLSAHDGHISRNDIEALPQFQSLWRSERQDLKELDAELFIPIKVHDVLVGIFLVGSKRSEQAFTMDDILTLSTVANQTAVAIENARLYTSEQTRLQEMDTLYSMARQLVTTDNLEDVVATVAEHALDSVQATYAKVITRDENGDYICQAFHNKPNQPVESYQGKIEPLVAEHYYNWILQGEQAVVVLRSGPDLYEEEKNVLFFENAQTICLSPLKGVAEHIGLLVLGDDHIDPHNSFSSTKIRLINVISDYATSAIQRAELHERLEENFLQTIVALATAMDARDSYTGDHSHRMSEIIAHIGHAMNLPEAEIVDLRWAAILHDIGKIGVPDEILNKPGTLTKKEWVIMKEHPVIGAEIVAPVKYLASVSPLIRSHHEKYDGTGYPYGLEGKDIPKGARILSVVDAYVAIRDERVYSKSHTHEEAIAELRRSSGSHFDPKIVDIFCKTITE